MCKSILLALIFSLSIINNIMAQDTLSVMAYNVLHYGDQCQGSDAFLHAQLKTIVDFTRPDVLGMVKAQAIKLSANDFAGVSPVGYADSILNHAFNNTYDHCPIVNFSNDPDGDMDLLFFNKKKLAFLSVQNLCTYQEDFNLYKLYYKDPNLSKTKDTTFLYFILNHTVSGTSSAQRDHQDSIIVKSLKWKFAHLPNLISMGDFNTHSSYEAGYQLLTASTDTSFIFSDPPYWPDQKLAYPSNWQNEPISFAGYLNTSTRETTLPNACGSDGGAKGWYLHMLLSPWIVNGKNYVKYIPNSYVTLGNDGHRVGLSINDSVSVGKNNSVPANVLNSLFRFSDKYPVMVKLALTSNTSGISLPNPEINSVTTIKPSDNFFIENPIEREIKIHFSNEMVGLRCNLKCYNSMGQLVQAENLSVDSNEITCEASFESGLYIISISSASQTKIWRILKK